MTHRQFIVQLESFQNEANNAARYIYGEMAVQHAASKSKRLLDRLNLAPTYWLASAAAFQTAGYICLGRIFDNNSKYNVSALLDSAERDLAVFQRSALAERKRDGKSTDPSWLHEYLDKAYYPTLKDFRLLRKKTDAYRAIYERAVKPARNKYIAHRERRGHVEVNDLFQRGKVKELWRLATFLLQLHTVLWQLYHNGRKPRFTSQRYSVASIFDAKSPSSAAHEWIVHDVKKLMRIIEGETPNPSIEGTRSGLRPPRTP